MMLISDIYPPTPCGREIDKPVFGWPISKDCPVCGTRIESIVAEGCPEEISRLFSIVACDDCASIHARLNKARQNLWDEQGEFNRGGREVKRLEGLIKGTRDAHKRQKFEGRLAAARENQKNNQDNIKRARAGVERVQQALATLGGKERGGLGH